MPSAGTQTPTPTPAQSAPVSGDPNPSSSGPATAEPSTAPQETTSPTPQATGVAAEVAVPGTLTVCTALVGAPATSTDETGQLVGYNVAYATELTARLDLTPVIQQVDFSALIPMLQSHTCDISVASQNITAARSAQISLIPYTQAKEGFPVVVQISNPLRIRNLADLCGLVVSAADGTTNVDQVKGTGDFVGQGLNDACVTDGKAAITLRTFPSEQDAVQALLDGSVVAYLGNSNIAAEYPGEIQTSTAVLPGTRQGIGVALDHPALNGAVQSALAAMIGDGTYLNILGQYVLSQSLDNISIIP
jgi:polar amino acid transport system substrate-binding protein